MIDLTKVPATILRLDTTLDDGATPFFTISAQLDSDIVTLDFRWSERLARWSLTATLAGAVIVAGQEIELYKDLFRYASARPAGALVAMTLAGNLTAPGLGDLASRIGLYYFPTT